MIQSEGIASPCGRNLSLESGTGRIDVKDSVVLMGGGKSYNDLNFPFTQIKRGVNLKPDFDETDLGLLFPQNDTTEKIFIITQMPHDREIGSDLLPHIHWTQKAATAVVWKLAYKWYNRGAAVPASWTTLTSNATVWPYVSGDFAQVSTFPTISGTGMGISSILKMTLWRDDNITTGDVLADQFDFHYLRDGFGSAQLYVKE